MFGSSSYTLNDGETKSKNDLSPVEENHGKYRSTNENFGTNGGAQYETGSLKLSDAKEAPFKNEDEMESRDSETSTTSSSSGSASAEAESKKKKEKPPMVGVAEVFRFADTKDRLLMLLGTLSACLQGAAMPLMLIVFGNMSNLFIYNAQWANIADVVAQNISEMCSPYCTYSAASNYSVNTPPAQLSCTVVTTAASFISTSTVSSVLPTIGDFCVWCVNVTGTEVTNNINQIIEVLTDYGCYQQVEQINKYMSSMSSNFMSQMSSYALYYTYIGCAVLVLGFFQMTCWYTTAYNQSQRIRSQLLKAILHQEIGWFDTHEVGELNTRLVDDVDQIENGIGDKLALLFQYFSTFITGFIVGFVYGWQLTLVILSISPLLAAAGGVMGQLLSSMTKKELAAYAKAGAVAEEVISAIRTVTAFGGQEKEALRYVSNLNDARKVGLRKGIVNGLGMGAVFLVLFGSYALAFWYGSTLVLSSSYTPGSMMIVFFSVLTGAFSIGAASPNIQDFANARGAAYAVYRVIDQKPSIDSSSDTRLKPAKLVGNIEFRNVVFRYPSRPDVKVVNGLNLKVNVGQTVALVGSSGCGKSTSVQLLQRFYDPIEGQVLIDGIDIRDYNLTWLRQHIGIVSQEPVLFGTTIAENIRYGREDATQEDIEQAAKQANAHNFISQLPQKYETLVGERGAQLSGGQKQRIAIARALVRDPTILLLDEATSALDTESEGIVQAALDKAREGRTTIVIAHRLSTIQTADIIAGVSNGVVVEQGTHKELMLQNGVYHTLAVNQKQQEDDDDAKQTIKYDGEDHDEKLFRSTSLQREISHTGGLERSRSQSVSSQRKMSIMEEKAKEEEKFPPAPLKRIIEYNLPEWPFILIGSIAALIMGCIQPAFAILFADILGVFSGLDPQAEQQKCNFFSGMFAVIGVVAFIASFLMQWMFSKSGEILTMRLRDKTFRSILKMEIAYFDDHLNSTGALCSRLSTDASAVKGATGSRLAVLVQSFGSIGFGLVIGFINSWELTLFVLAFAPFMLITGFVRVKIITGTRGERNKKMEEAAKLAVEAIENIRTVATLTQEEKFATKFNELINVPYSISRRKARIIGLAYGFSQGIVFFANAATFYFGAWLVAYNGLNYESMFKVLSAILFGAMAAGQASSFAPDYGKAKMSAARLFALFDRVPPIDCSSDAGEKAEEFLGSVELRDVRFRYPTRTDVTVLKGLNIAVQPGQVVALVGSSGCGKSTVVQLIERFYDPESGHVLVDGMSADSLNLQWLRRQIGIVSQEPVLFDCSIRENIAYGDNFREVSMEEIIDAARKANIHSFIESLPQGYETNAGDKGAQLSGGQKQRVAIARALIRRPKILLLDEATSALDTESEKVVQEALERAQEGRTSIVIAHRLSTVQKADCIIVIQNGRVAETGTHSELIAKRGIYYRLNNRQTASGQ